MATVTAVALAGTSAPAALADDCPNAAVRAQQQSQHLPNCMAYEQVTPHEKAGAVPLLRAVAEDGGGVLFAMQGMLGETLSFADPQYRSVRGAAADSWTTDALLPALNGPVRRPLLADLFTPVAWSRDLSRTLFQTQFPLAPNDKNSGTGVNQRLLGIDLYLREADGSYRWLVADPALEDTSVSQHVQFVSATPDLERVVLTSQRPWDPRSPSGTMQLYMSTSEGVRAVSVLPGGTLPTAGIRADDVEASADGRRVAFGAAVGGTEQVYVRFNAHDPSSASTRAVAMGPNGEVCQTPTRGSSPPHRQLQRLSDDGSRVIFRCLNALLPGAPENANYVRDLDGGPAAVRLLDSGIVLAANADFSRIYTEGTDASSGGEGSLSVFRDGVATLVATVAQRGLFRQNLYPSISPDGEYFAFQSQDKFDLPGVDQGSAGEALGTVSATPQVFVASARTRELRCVSCQPRGTATAGAGQLGNNDLAPGPSFNIGPSTAMVGGVTSRGSIAFHTSTPLVAQDINGASDAYAWVDGRPVLLSGGRSRELSVAAGVSPDGRSFFVTTPDALVRDDVDGGQYDVYAVREGGGKLVADPPAGCETNCQGPGAERPGLPGLGSTDVLGRGNLVEETTKAKGPARAKASLTGSRSVRGSSTKVRVKVSRAGSIRVSGAGVRQATVKAKKAGTYRVTVRLSAYGAKQQRARGRMATTLTARFTPESGASVSARTSIRFTAARKGGR